MFSSLVIEEIQNKAAHTHVITHNVDVWGWGRGRTTKIKESRKSASMLVHFAENCSKRRRHYIMIKGQFAKEIKILNIYEPNVIASKYM